ncbi:STE3-domain-containing protein [Pleurotus eryngii]|uniref:STE3-domain-containing protein n=1 Tax=Pleurotus eryngii TaxID=5323 RepID=A0A9P5ZUL5_PLEER|nr:STE3-domain-containing protein [Pleurotus eryngii]UWI70541.1 pheromone receptor B4 [Pleurotus eryngii]
MTDAPAVISLVCAGFFVLFLFADRVRLNTPTSTLITWFFICNLIHGVNAVIWKGNVDIKIPIWCDITTRLLLGANVGLPATFICIARKLEFVSSQREPPLGGENKRVQIAIDVALCIVLPIIYILLHYIAQDRRFDLVRDLGCFASIHPSTPALIIVWLPPLLTCSIALLFCGITIHNSFRISTSSFGSHVSSRSTYTSSVFIRTLIISLITSAVLGLTSLFALFSPPRLSNWTSWRNVHENSYDIDTISTKNELTSIQFAWWGLKAVSIVYLVLSLAIGQEIRDGAKLMRSTIVKWNKGGKRHSVPSILMMHTQQTQMVTKCSPPPLSPPPPLTLELKSGWDDMLDDKASKGLKSKNPSKLSLSPSSGRSASSDPSSSPCSSPTPSSARSSPAPENDSFAIDTLNYLNSPIAQSLGLRSLPPVYSSPQKTSYNITPWRRPQTPTKASTPVTPSAVTVEVDIAPPKAQGPTRQSIPDDAKSTVSSIWEAPWPEPPASVPQGSPTPSLIQGPFHARSSSRSLPQSRCSSPALSCDTLGLPILSSSSPPVKPFQGAAAEALPGRPGSSPAAIRPPRRSSLRRLGGLEGLNVPGIGRGVGNRAGKEIIYMTVVKETV